MPVDTGVIVHFGKNQYRLASSEVTGGELRRLFGVPPTDDLFQAQGTKAIEPGSSPRSRSLKTRIGKKELGAAAKCNVTGLATRELLPFNPFRSSCIVTLAFSTIIF